MRICSKQRIGGPIIAAVLLVTVLVVITFYNGPYIKPGFQHHNQNDDDDDSSVILERNQTTQSLFHRKLLGRMTTKVVEPNRMWGDKCSKSDIIVNQGPTAPLPNGIPTYTVEIMNVCSGGCDISNIHLTCGWFSSARLINPKVFKRLRYDDCIVNNGKALVNGGTLSFQYANTFRYPLSVASVDC